MCVRRSCRRLNSTSFFFFFQAEDGIRDGRVTGVQTCALPILSGEEPRLWNTTHVYMHKSALGHGGDFFGDGQRLFRARANCWTSQVIARQKKARKTCQIFADGSQPVAVPEIVLRKCPRPNRDVREHGAGLDGKQGGDLAMDDARKLLVVQPRGSGVGCSPNETGEERMPVGRAPGEKRGIPDRTENAQTGGPRNEEPEAVQ